MECLFYIQIILLDLNQSTRLSVSLSNFQSIWENRASNRKREIIRKIIKKSCHPTTGLIYKPWGLYLHCPLLYLLHLHSFNRQVLSTLPLINFINPSTFLPLPYPYVLYNAHFWGEQHGLSCTSLTKVLLYIVHSRCSRNFFFNWGKIEVRFENEAKEM